MRLGPGLLYEGRTLQGARPKLADFCSATMAEFYSAVDRMSSASFYKWRAKFGGMDASLISEMKDMAEENRRLKRMYAEISMQNDLLKEALGKKR